jgi:hypothetical protein
MSAASKHRDRHGRALATIRISAARQMRVSAVTDLAGGETFLLREYFLRGDDWWPGAAGITLPSTAVGELVSVLLADARTPA